MHQPMRVCVIYRVQTVGYHVDADVYLSALHREIGRQVTVKRESLGYHFATEETIAEIVAFAPNLCLYIDYARIPDKLAGIPSVLLVNHELYTPPKGPYVLWQNDFNDIDRMAAVCAKTVVGYDHLVRLRVPNLRLVPHLSTDRMGANFKRVHAAPSFVHFGGSHNFSGTDRVILTWLRAAQRGYPSLPPITVYMYGKAKLESVLKYLNESEEADVWIPAPHTQWTPSALGSLQKFGLDIQLRKLRDAELTRAMARHDVWLQPSLREGFGHILNESRAASAVLLTTDAEPNRSFTVSPTQRIPATPMPHKPHKTPPMVCSLDAIEYAVRTWWDTDEVARRSIGSIARYTFEQQQHDAVWEVQQMWRSVEGLV